MQWILIIIFCVVAFVVSKFSLFLSAFLCCCVGYITALSYPEVLFLAKFPSCPIFMPDLYLSNGNNNCPVVVVVAAMDAIHSHVVILYDDNLRCLAINSLACLSTQAHFLHILR